jgi:hypothetical protein
MRRFDGGRTWTSSVEISTDPPAASNLTAEWSDGPYMGEGYDGSLLGSVTVDKETNTVFVHYSMCFDPCIQYGCVRPSWCGADYTSRLFQVFSNDSFSTWSDPVDVTAGLNDSKSGSNLHSFNPGPGSGTQAKSGRLIICGYDARF